MCQNIQNIELKDALEAQETLKSRGFTSSCGRTGAVVVDRWKHVRGIWHYHNGYYFWTDAGYSQPSFRAESLESSVSYTLKVIATV